MLQPVLKIVFLLFLSVLGIKSFSQQEYFLYIQAEDHQPFYARINNKIYSSLESGYLIIPKLEDSTYLINIGFAKNSFPEQRFLIDMDKKDKGFQLKNFGEKGWGLSNVQTMAVIMNTGPVPTSSGLSGTRKTDAFSELLAKVVNDTAILYTASISKPVEVLAEKPVIPQSIPPGVTVKDNLASIPVIEATKKVDQPDSLLVKANTPTTSSEVPAKDIAAETPANSTKNPVIEPETPKKTAVEKPFITRIEEDNSEGLYSATYIEQYNFYTDTIHIFIPQNARLLVNPTARKETQPDSIALQNTPVEEKTVQKVPAEEKTVQKVPVEEKKVQKPPVEEKKVTPQPVISENTTASKPAIQIFNSDCKNFATDYDVDKLRVKLLGEKVIDDKMMIARKFFKSKCFTVAQINALSELFFTDETRYRFFDLAYPFVSDPANFYKLADIIESDYYKNRFKAMVHQ